MKIWKASQILFLAALAAILLLTACTSTARPEGNDTSITPGTPIGDTSDSDKNEPVEDTSDPEKEKEDLPQQPEDSAEPEPTYAPTEPWQDTYISLLGTIRAENTGHHVGLDDDSYIEYDATSYQLYDIDKDGIPELIVEYGNSEASRRVHIYTIHDGGAVQAGSEYDGEMYTGHGSLYTWPGENGVTFYYAHMGAAGAARWTLADGGIASEGIFDEYTEDYSAYTDIETIVPDTQSIDSFSIDVDLPVLRYQQTRADWENRLPVKRGTVDAAAVRQTLLDVMENNGMVHGAVSDPYASGVGYMSFQDYLGPGMADEYAKYPLHVSRYAWADVNGDGQLECVLQLARSEQDSYPSDTYAVMSLQEDEVYVYGWSYFEGTVLENGIFASASYWEPDTLLYAKRLIFDGEDCFQYSVELTPEVGEVTWESLAG